MTVFFRILDAAADEKARVLRAAIAGEPNGVSVFDMDTSAFSEVPGSPFAYWLNGTIRKLYSSLPKFELQNERAVRLGASTKYDARFVRLWFEPHSVDEVQWSTYANGGRFGRFFQDYLTIVRSGNHFKELGAYLVQKFPYLKGEPGWILHLENDYSEPAIGWPLRTHAFSPHALPANTVFSARTYAAYVPRNSLASVAALLASLPVDFLLKVMLGRSEHPEFVTGVVRALPWLPSPLPANLAILFKQGWQIARRLALSNETSRHFIMPRIILEKYLVPATTEIDSIQTAINEIAFDIYGLSREDRAAIESWGRASPPLDAILPEPEGENEDTQEQDDGHAEETTGDDEALMSWAIGVTVGRFDIRLATGERPIPPEPEPFDALPSKSPGMLPNGDAPFMPCSGVLVDDPGHSDDLTTRVTAVYERIGASSPAPDIFRRRIAHEFFSSHLGMYSKSRRKAPIYWQIATPSASYSVWLYIHAFTKDTLFNVQTNYVASKLRHEERRLESMRLEFDDNSKATERKQLATQESFVEELRTLLDEVKRVAPLWNPFLDDGVILTMAPLWRLVPHHRPWQQELKSKWDDLCAGKCDWAHLAMHLWPERVLPKCATDRSLAIAHGLEDIFWAEGDDGKWNPRPVPTRPVDNLVTERMSPAVKAALKSLLEAPVAATGARDGRGRRRTVGVGGAR